MPRKRRAALAALLLLAAAVGVRAQARPGQPPAAGGDFCESNIAYLDAAHSAAGEDGLIIAIARLGNGERNTTLNRRRLYNLRTYLEKFRRRDGKTIITAEGERVRGPGRVEIYVGGKLGAEIELRRGEDLHVGSCDASSSLDRLFYDSRTPTGRGAYIPSGPRR